MDVKGEEVVGVSGDELILLRTYFITFFYPPMLAVGEFGRFWMKAHETAIETIRQVHKNKSIQLRIS